MSIILGTSRGVKGHDRDAKRGRLAERTSRVIRHESGTRDAQPATPSVVRHVEHPLIGHRVVVQIEDLFAS